MFERDFALLSLITIAIVYVGFFARKVSKGANLVFAGATAFSSALAWIFLNSGDFLSGNDRDPDYGAESMAPISALKGVEIGMPELLIKVEMGTPTKILNRDGKKIIYYDQSIPEAIHFDFMTVTFDELNKASIVCIKGAGPISIHEDEDLFLERVGKPERTLLDSDGRYKAFFYTSKKFVVLSSLKRIKSVCISQSGKEFVTIGLDFDPVNS